MCVRLTLLLLALASSVACAHVTVEHVKAAATPKERVKAEGVFYALPKTVAKVLVKIQKTEKTTAPFMMFAPIFAPAGKPLCDSPEACRRMKDTVAYALLQETAFGTSGEPDPENVYLVQLSGGGTLDQAMSMAWTDAGLATTASASVTNRMIDVAVAGVKLASSLGTKAFLGASAVTQTKDTKKCPSGSAADTDRWVIPELSNIDNNGEASALAIANYCDMKDELRKQYVESTDRALLERAVQSFKIRVLPFSSSRFTLLTQATNVLDPLPLIDRLDKIVDAELKNLFLGSSDKTVWDPTFEVRDIKLDSAADADKTRVELLQIDAAKGPCPKAALTVDSKPLPSDFAASDLNCNTSLPSVTLGVTLYPASGQLFETVTSRVNLPNNDDEDRSFRYRIPAQVRATVLLDKKEYGSGVFSVAQLGQLASLPAKRASKTLSYDLAFIEQTGGLRSFKIGSTGMIDAATAQAISDAGGTYLDARNAKQVKDKAAADAAATAADELTLLTRQDAIIKMKHEICEIQKQYGLACTVQP